MPRFHCPVPLASGQALALPPGAARHVQVLRLQPGTRLTLFNGEGGEFDATVERMGRSDVHVQVGAHDAVEREARHRVTLAVGIPANERMDWLVEKATELGAAAIQPLLTERTVLRLAGERAAKRLVHWQGIAIAACEQCGRNRVPVIHPLLELRDWLGQVPAGGEDARVMLALREGAQPLPAAFERAVTVLSGPEGGLSAAEEEAAARARFEPVTLGPRVLRAETAPLALLSRLG
jgi:16S rRNA (uracil1498-N3)-methyltransferase